METFHELIQGNQPVLVDFHALWCGPCKQMAPELQRFAHDHAGKLRVVKVDIDKNRERATEYNIQGVPTLILFKEGQPVWRQSGAMSAAQMQQMVTPYL